MFTAGLLACLALVPREEPAQRDTPPAPRTQLPEFLARAKTDAVPATLAADLGAAGRAPGLAAGALDDPATWKAWRGALERALEADDTAARTRLALVALEQGRHVDAWRHFEHCASDPALLAALLPRFVPGVERGTPLAHGGRAAPLADGALLRPALPPPLAHVPGTDPRFARRVIALGGIVVGAATISLQVAVEGEGVQVELAHESGGAARVRIVIPRAEEYGVSAEYVDWLKQETLGAPLEVTLAPGEEPHVLFARFEPRDPRWPTSLPADLPASIGEHGLVLVGPADEPRNAAERGTLARIAAELSQPSLGLVCRLRGVNETAAGGVAVDLCDPAGRAEKLAWLVSAIERFAARKHALSAERTTGPPAETKRTPR